MPSEKDTPLLKALAELFPGQTRWGLCWILTVGAISAVFETLGVASILPFMALALDPTTLQRSHTIQSAMALFGVTTTQGGLLLVGGFTVAVIALGNLSAAVNMHLQQRFMATTEARLSSRLFAGYLRQPYAFHVKRDAPSLLKVLYTDIFTVVNNIVMPLIMAASKMVMALGILAILVARGPMMAATLAGVLLLTYLAIYRVVRHQQAVRGQAADRTSEICGRIAQEGLGGVKEFQVLGRVQVPIDAFAEAILQRGQARAANQEVAQFPRYVLETVAFGGILLVALFKIATSESGAPSIIPVLALYAFAGYRLLPAFQQVFAAAINVRFSRPSLSALLRDMRALSVESPAEIDESASRSISAVGTLQDKIAFNDVSFTYPGASRPALRDVSLVIAKGESVGLVGRTGAGKTTLADLVLGLYEPDSGTVTIDGAELTGPAVRAWQERVGYVPQSVFLANGSIAANIAFGIAGPEIDGARVVNAARMAHLDEFIATLPAGYDTNVGERGVKLSGGQRQRIGIARALYHEPDVLVFDEATSALDGLTEDSVMEAIRFLAGTRTVILIAHRLRTVEACDRIVMIDEGRVVAQGSYHGLMDTSAAFRDFVGRRDSKPVVQGSI